MSSKSVIKVVDLSKCYQIYENPTDRLKQFVLPGIKQIIGGDSRQYYREFWALKNIDFEIKKGETVGIIGRNGAGKSTLLQILCGTLFPSSGRIEITGRVAALLELGSGFNPEFTGRENVYMNAGILGLTEAEINDRYADIIEFADIGDFIEQPVKTYSSGMVVRLAFAVIAHVSADILIIDEALSVGDMYFQAKCMAHIKKLMASGVTILFVSHDVASVKALCTKAIYLDRGTVSAYGDTEKVVEVYYGHGVIKSQSAINESDDLSSELNTIREVPGNLSNSEFQARANFQRIQSGAAEFVNVELLNANQQKIPHVLFGQEVILRVIFKTNIEILTLGTAYHIRDKNGFEVVYSDTFVENIDITNTRVEEIFIIDWKFNVSLKEGDYTIATMLSIPQDMSIGSVQVCDFVPIAVQFQVIRGKSLPIYGAVHWQNDVDVQRYV